MKKLKFSAITSPRNSMKVFGKSTKTQNNSPKYKNTNNSPWFNAECKNAKKDFTKARNTFLKHKSDFNRQNFTKNRTIYNRIKNNAKRLHKINEGRKLNDEA